jgi:hypothetical protein
LRRRHWRNIVGLGYSVVKISESQRILPHGVAQKFEVSSSDALVATTKPVSVIVTGAGLARVEQFEVRVT